MTRVSPHPLLETVGRAPIVRMQRWGRPGKLLAHVEKLSPGGSIEDRVAAAALATIGGPVVVVGRGLAAISAAALARLMPVQCTAIVHPPCTAEMRALVQRWATAAHFVESVEAARERAGALLAHGASLLELDDDAAASVYETHAAPAWLQRYPPDLYALVAPAGPVAIGLSRALSVTHPHVTVHAARAVGIPGGDGPTPASVDMPVHEIPAPRAWAVSQALAAQEGLHVGLESGAVAAAARDIIASHGGEPTLALVLPDGGERYYSLAPLLEESS